MSSNGPSLLRVSEQEGVLAQASPLRYVVAPLQLYAPALQRHLHTGASRAAAAAAVAAAIVAIDAVAAAVALHVAVIHHSSRHVARARAGSLLPRVLPVALRDAQSFHHNKMDE